MKQIALEQIRRDNTNIRKFSDSLWRELRKERFRKANPNKFVNQMAAEQLSIQMDPHSDFRRDVEQFIKTRLTEREAKIFGLFVFGGKIRQSDIGEILGVCQATVANDLNCALALFKEWYFDEGETRYE